MTVLAAKKEIQIWDAVLTPAAGVTIDWKKFGQKFSEPVQIDELSFAEACEALTYAESDLLIDEDGKLYVVGMREEEYAIYPMPELRFVELAQFNSRKQYCSHRNLALCVDENLDEQLSEFEVFIKDLTREYYESDKWYANATERARIILDAEQSARRT